MQWSVHKQSRSISDLINFKCEWSIMLLFKFTLHTSWAASALRAKPSRAATSSISNYHRTRLKWTNMHETEMKSILMMNYPPLRYWHRIAWLTSALQKATRPTHTHTHTQSLLVIIKPPDTGQSWPSATKQFLRFSLRLVLWDSITFIPTGYCAWLWSILMRFHHH